MPIHYTALAEYDAERQNINFDCDSVVATDTSVEEDSCPLIGKGVF